MTTNCPAAEPAARLALPNHRSSKLAAVMLAAVLVAPLGRCAFTSVGVRWAGKAVLSAPGGDVPALVGPPDARAISLTTLPVLLSAFNASNPRDIGGLSALLGITADELAQAQVIGFEYNGGAAPTSHWESSRWTFADGRGHELTVDLTEPVHPVDPATQPPQVFRSGDIQIEDYPKYASLFGMADPGPSYVVSWVLFKLPPEIDTTSPDFTIQIMGGHAVGLPGEGTPDPDAAGVIGFLGPAPPPLILDWFTIAGGGGNSTGGPFSLDFTIGEATAGGPLTGGDYSLVTGFWSAFAVAQPLGKGILRIELSAGNSATVAWPLDSTGWVLQESLVIGPAAVWTDVTNRPVVVNGQNTVALPNTATGPASHYFRLRP